MEPAVCVITSLSCGPRARSCVAGEGPPEGAYGEAWEPSSLTGPQFTSIGKITKLESKRRPRSES